MKKLILLFVGIACIVAISKAQPVEDELGFKYVKAKYLMETERYEDAIKAFTKILKIDDQYEDALLYRAEAKYAMGAYKGVKKDVILYITDNGINDRALVLLGKADYRLQNNEAALRSLLVATGSAMIDGQVYEYIGNIYQKDGKLFKACDFWQEGASLGSSKCESKSRKVCGSTRPTSNDTSEKTKKEDNGRSGGLGKANKNDELGTHKEKAKIDIKGKHTKSKSNKESDTEDEQKEEEESVDKPEKKEESNLPPEDDTPNILNIDEELTITIYGSGLGKRKILDQPNILILSDDVGEVAIDICINRRGKVEYAELNTELSSISKPSLISLAIRKAKDFWFEKNDYKEQCGVMIFNKK